MRPALLPARQGRRAARLDRADAERRSASTIWRFSTTRMLHEYTEQLYLPAAGAAVSTTSPAVARPSGSSPRPAERPTGAWPHRPPAEGPARSWPHQGRRPASRPPGDRPGTARIASAQSETRTSAPCGGRSTEPAQADPDASPGSSSGPERALDPARERQRRPARPGVERHDRATDHPPRAGRRSPASLAERTRTEPRRSATCSRRAAARATTNARRAGSPAFGSAGIRTPVVGVVVALEPDLVAVVDARRAGQAELEQHRQAERGPVPAEDRQRPRRVVAADEVELDRHDIRVVVRHQASSRRPNAGPSRGWSIRR